MKKSIFAVMFLLLIKGCGRGQFPFEDLIEVFASSWFWLLCGIAFIGTLIHKADSTPKTD